MTDQGQVKAQVPKHLSLLKMATTGIKTLFQHIFLKFFLNLSILKYFWSHNILSHSKAVILCLLSEWPDISTQKCPGSHDVLESKLRDAQNKLTPLWCLGLRCPQEPCAVWCCCAPPQTDFCMTQEEYYTWLQEMDQLLGAMHGFQSLPKMPFALGLSATSV